MKINDQMRLEFINGLMESEGRGKYYRAYQLYNYMDRRIKFVRQHQAELRAKSRRRRSR